jgi:hypothetical protein
MLHDPRMSPSTGRTAALLGGGQSPQWAVCVIRRHQGRRAAVQSASHSSRGVDADIEATPNWLGAAQPQVCFEFTLYRFAARLKSAGREMAPIIRHRAIWLLWQLHLAVVPWIIKVFVTSCPSRFRQNQPWLSPVLLSRRPDAGLARPFRS